jgi:hypothetical protein
MKWIQKLFVVLFVVLASSMAMAYDYADAVDSNNDGVGIAPNPVTTYDNMYAVMDFDVEDPIYTWEKNGVEQAQYVGSRIPVSELVYGDTWEVTVSAMEYVGGYVGYVQVELGSEEIEVGIETILGGPLDDEEFNPFVIPELDATDIHLTVFEGTLVNIDVEEVDSYFEYQYYETITRITQSNTIYVYDKEGFFINVEYDSLLDENGQWQTDYDDSGVYDVIATITDGRGHRTQATVTITVINSGIIVIPNNEPLATDIHLTAVEGDLVDIDFKQVESYLMYQYYESFTRAMQSDTIYAFDADDDTLKVSYDSLLNSFGTWQTDLDDSGVYTIIATVTDGTDSTNAVIELTILDSGTIDNECPVVVAEDQTVYEGDLVELEYTATDADGDNLIVGFSLPLNAVGSWQTEVGDAGVYTVIVAATDGLCSVSDEAVITVLAEGEEPCEDLNNNGICDSEEPVESGFEGDQLSVHYVTVLNAKDLSSAYNVDGTCYKSGSKDDEIKVYVEMQNDNSYDAEGIVVTMIFDGKAYKKSFQDLDRSEVGSAVFSVPIPEDLETGRYPLLVRIDSSDINYETAFNLNVKSMSESVPAENPVEEVLNLWDRIKDFLRNLF